MRVLFVTTSFPSDSSDWRGTFMRHIVGSLARREDLALSVWAPPGELPLNATSVTSPAESKWLAGLMSSGGISHILRTKPFVMLTAPVRLLYLLAAVYRRRTDVDVYHINWLQCAIPLPPNRVPALISVLGNDLMLLRLPFVRLLLRRVMQRRNVAICPNADWMRGPLDAAFGDIAKIVPSSFGIDKRWFAIKREPPRTTPVWLAVTRLTKRKLGKLFEWSAPYFREGIRELHLFGPMQEEISVPAWVYYHGIATADQLAGEWLPKACGLITLSEHAEGRPQVMIETMAAGLPIIASRTDAHADVVMDGKTGLLCDSLKSYGDALQALEDAATNTKLGDAARTWAATEFGTWDDCANRYASVYRELLAGKRLND